MRSHDQHLAQLPARELSALSQHSANRTTDLLAHTVPLQCLWQAVNEVMGLYTAAVYGVDLRVHIMVAAEVEAEAL